MDFEKEYERLEESYAVSESVWMTPTYSRKGQVCQMRLHLKRFSDDSTLLSRQLSFNEWVEAINRLVPVDSRGERKEPFGSTATGGSTAWTTYTHEKVTFIFISAFKVSPDSWKESKPYVISEQQFSTPQKQELVGTHSDDFSNNSSSKVETVIIKWNKRKCDATPIPSF